MSFFKGYFTIFYYDIKRALWKIALVSFVLFIGMVSTTTGLDRVGSIADVFLYLLNEPSYSRFSVPLFLFILFFVLQPLFDPMRIHRMNERKQIVIHIYWIVFVTVILFIVFYFFVGFIYGWYKSGTLTNTWVTKEGKPYQILGDDIDLSMFSTGYMVIRFTLTAMVVFYFIGLITAFLHIIFPRFVFVFLLIEGILIFDNVLIWFMDFSLFSRYVGIWFDNWGMAPFIGNLSYFFGLSIVVAVLIYLYLMKYDFVQEKEGES